MPQSEQRMKITHMEEQGWERIRGLKDDICRIADNDGPQGERDEQITLIVMCHVAGVLCTQAGDAIED